MKQFRIRLFLLLIIFLLKDYFLFILTPWKLENVKLQVMIKAWLDK